MSAEDSHKALFSYGHMRAHYTGRGFDTNGCLLIEQFIRPENLAGLSEALKHDRVIFSQCPNTQLQSQLSPIGRQCLWELQSGIMIRLLENITHLENLLPDTHCSESFFAVEDNSIPKSSQKNNGNTTSALTLTICLNTGNATLTYSSTANSQPLSGNTLQFCYWQYQNKTEQAAL